MSRFSRDPLLKICINPGGTAMDPRSADVMTVTSGNSAICPRPLGKREVRKFWDVWPVKKHFLNLNLSVAPSGNITRKWYRIAPIKEISDWPGNLEEAENCWDRVGWIEAQWQIPASPRWVRRHGSIRWKGRICAPLVMVESGKWLPTWGFLPTLWIGRSKASQEIDIETDCLAQLKCTQIGYEEFEVLGSHKSSKSVVASRI